jgi:hypothetical protein
MSKKELSEITIKRISSGGNGVFGVMLQYDIPFAVTLERPWNDNKRNLSCIPHGRYICKKVKSPKFGITYEVTGVQNRSNILFHCGNTKKSSKGCILIGEEFGILNGNRAILSSKKGFEEFMKNLQYPKQANSFILNIHEFF